MGVRVITPATRQSSHQGLDYFEGVSAESAGATGLCLHRIVVPAGGRARAHLHAHHESAIYVLRGDVRMYWGEAFEHCAEVHSGDFIYIPTGVPHLPVNLSDTDDAMALVARTDPREQESVVLRPDLDALAP